jgi:hypothetical protein
MLRSLRFNALVYDSTLESPPWVVHAQTLVIEFSLVSVQVFGAQVL